MDIETLERANILKKDIDEIEKTIDKLKKVKESQEIIVVVNRHEIQDALKDMWYYGTHMAPAYYTGDIKEKIVDVVLEENIRLMNEKLEEFKKL